MPTERASGPTSSPAAASPPPPTCAPPSASAPPPKSTRSKSTGQAAQSNSLPSPTSIALSPSPKARENPSHPQNLRHVVHVHLHPDISKFSRIRNATSPHLTHTVRAAPHLCGCILDCAFISRRGADTGHTRIPPGL